MSDNDSARRVVLLARPGPARERMREALVQAAAMVVLEADPTATDPAEVAAARPDVALIVLDAATDEALDRFDALLSDPSVEVLFEEAELAVGRAGWDAARWVRHLAAKLHRSGDVLPPGAGPAETDKPAETSPTSAGPSPTAEPPVESAAPVATPDWSLSAIPELPELPDLPPAGEAATGTGATDVPMPELESTALDHAAPVDSTPVPPELPPLELPEPAQPSPGFQSTFDIHGDMAVQETGEISLAPLQLDEEFLTTSSDSLAPLEGLELPGTDAAFDSAGADELRAEPSSLPGSRFELELVDDPPSGLSLESVDGGSDSPAEAHQFHNDLADLHDRIASMELVIDRPSSQVRGAVLVLAGIGGPDAVRQLLGALPGNFPRAVLVQQRLDGGHYDKLVAQMQRATQLLVELAVPGRPLQPSSVYILSPAIGVEPGPSGLVFTDAPGDLLASLPAGDSAVLMLSGSDPNQVEAVMKLSVGGALVAAQALDGCYDVAAPAALASRGGNVAKPQDLARRLAERWAA